MRRRVTAAIVLGALAAAGAACSPPPGPEPDAIYHNAKVVTVNDGFEVAEAVAVADGRIVAVGSDATVTALARPTTRMVDLGGKPLLPASTTTTSTSAGRCSRGSGAAGSTRFRSGCAAPTPSRS